MSIRPVLFTLLVSLTIAVLTPVCDGQIGGNGKDGPFTPTANTILDTARNGGIFNFTRVVIPTTVTVAVVGPNPAILLSQGDVVVLGILSADGESVEAFGRLPGRGGPGGFSGGQGGIDSGLYHGDPGKGPGGGKGGQETGPSYHPTQGGGGGGHATAGLPGVSPWGGAAGGHAYGSAFPFDLSGGSGGGGGYNKQEPRQYSGAGGGGALQILADGKIDIDGRISASGGGAECISNALPGIFGGAGSGGSIYLRSLQGVEIRSNGSVLAMGGVGFNLLYKKTVPLGGTGFIRLDAYGQVPLIVGKVDPSPMSLSLPYLHEMSPPRLGQAWVLRLASLPSDGVAIYFSLRGANIPLPPFGTLKLDPQAGFFLLGAVRLPAGGVDPVRDLPVVVPAHPNLKGLRLHVQSVNYLTATNQPRLSNAVVTTIR